MKHRYFFFPFFSFLVCISCTPSHYNLGKQTGLHKIIGRQCDLSEGLYNPCDDARFIELVKGRFHGIEQHQVGLVIWRVESSDRNGGPLLYDAKAIRNHDALLLEEDRIWVENNAVDTQGNGQSFLEKEKEFFLLKDGALSDYYFMLDRHNKTTGQIFKRHFHYQIVPVTDRDIQRYEFIYPEDME